MEERSKVTMVHITTLSTRQYLSFDQFMQLKKNQKICYTFFKHACEPEVIGHPDSSLCRKDLILFFLKYFLLILDRVVILNRLLKYIYASARTFFSLSL